MGGIVSPSLNLLSRDRDRDRDRKKKEEEAGSSGWLEYRLPWNESRLECGTIYRHYALVFYTV